MIYKQIIKQLFWIIFTIFQSIKTLIGPLIILFCWYAYFSIHDITTVTFQPSIFITLIGIALLLNGLFGIRTMLKDSIFRTGVFLLTVVAVFNLEAIQLIRNNRLVDNSGRILQGILNGMTNNQVSYVQDQFKCCGYANVVDKVVYTCEYSIPCAKVFYETCLSARYYLNSFTFILIGIESIGLIILCSIRFLY